MKKKKHNKIVKDYDEQKRLKELGLWDGKVDDDPYSLVSRKK